MELIMPLAIVVVLLGLVTLVQFDSSNQLRTLTKRIHHMALDLAGLQAKIADLKTSVDALIALPTNPAPVDLQPAGDAVDALKAEVDAKLTAPAP